MFNRLTMSQAQLIRSFIRETDAVYFHGLDQNDLPVISFADAHGDHEAFAMLRSARRHSLPLSGVQTVTTVTEPAFPLRWYTDDELDTIDPESHALLSVCQRR